MENSFFITNMAEKVEKGSHTLFLNPNESRKVIGILNKKNIKYDIFYPYKHSEKIIIYKNRKPNVILLKILIKEEVKHSDILGTLFANQISPNQYGDIIVDKNNYYIMILDLLFPYFQTQFNKIGKYDIKIEKVDLNLIKNYEYDYETINCFSNSLRIDSVVASITSLSRSSVDEMFLKKDILLWYENVKKIKVLKEGDILSIRKYGKYKINRILEKNRKGKIKIEIYKYK